MTAIQNPELTKVLTQTRSEQLEQLRKIRDTRAAHEAQAQAALEQEKSLELVIHALNEALFPVEGLLQPLTRPIPMITTAELLQWVETAPKHSQLTIIEDPSSRESVFSKIEAMSPLSTPREWAGRRSIIRADNELIVHAHLALVHFVQETFIAEVDFVAIATLGFTPADFKQATEVLPTHINPKTVIALLADA